MEDKVIYKVQHNGVYEDLWEEVYIWLDSTPDVGTVKANFRGVYDYLTEISTAEDRCEEGLYGISVKVPSGFGMLDYAERVAKKFNLPYTTETQKGKKGSVEILTMYIKEGAPCVKMPFKESDKKYREEWYKRHNNNRTSSWSA